MLNEALPKIVTEMLPGPISKSVIERRERVVPNAIKCVYPCVCLLYTSPSPRDRG
mgnify:CR=1 FL=1